ncbi:MAG TPA: isopentenyl-diphosphate Delta-isomerase [Pseudomonadales bacterium]|nr:isopentenyl-diphosphate Delta-isomerase [Pseudomonadales bacterium]
MNSVTSGDLIVSDERDLLILVDEQDRPQGSLDKASCHDGDGILHRAFSLFIFDDAGRLLLQRRADGKRLWPGFWSNSCCSHPRHGETMDEAVHRRLEQELGLSCTLLPLYKFRYQARYGVEGSEHELCSVYIGRSDSDPSVNSTEISAWRWIPADDLDAELDATPDAFTPWFKLEWSRIRREHMDAVSTL